MNLKQLHKKFIQLENRLELDEEEIFLLWYYSRYKIFDELKKKYLQHEEGQLGADKQNLSNYLSFDKTLNLLRKNPFSASGKDYLILGHPRKKYVNKEWKDIYTCNVQEDLENDFIYLEKPFRLEHKGYVARNVYFTDIINVLKRFKNFITVSPALTNKIRFLAKKLKKEFNQDINYQNIILNAYRINEIEKYFYRKILDRIKPKKVFVVVWYANLGLVNACREKKIPVIEIQHGVIDKYHMGYFWGAEVEEKFYSYFPSIILTFGEYWNKKISLPNKNAEKVSIGFDYFNTEVAKYNSKERENKGDLLFITQKSIGGQLRKFIKRFTNEYPNIKVGIKIHPAEDMNLYKKELGDSNSITFFESENIYELYSKYQYICGVYSTALYESLASGNNTIIISSIDGWQYLQDLIDENMVFSVSDTEELAKIVTDKIQLEIQKANSIFESYNSNSLSLILEEA